MQINRRELKSQSRQAMSAARPAPYWVTLAMLGIVIVLNVLLMSLDGTWQAMRQTYSAALEGEIVYVEPQALGGLTGWLLSMAVQIMIWELSVGFMLYSVRVWRREKAGCGDLFDSFGVFFRSIWIQLIPSLLISLWGVIYVLPASTMIVMTGQLWWLVACLPLTAPMLIASYAYRMAVYIMLDNPSLSCWQCIRLSRQVMRGHKMELFLLDLSYVGWFLLCLIPVAGTLLAVWVMAYQHVADAGFYERVMNLYMTENAPFPGAEPPAV